MGRDDDMGISPERMGPPGVDGEPTRLRPPLPPAEQARWDANVDAVQAAKARGYDAVRQLAAVEDEVAREVARRGGGYPDQPQRDRLIAARARVNDARAAHEAAKERFKAGVTSGHEEG